MNEEFRYSIASVIIMIFRWRERRYKKRYEN
jgi:hypothetical protein